MNETLIDIPRQLSMRYRLSYALNNMYVVLKKVSLIIAYGVTALGSALAWATKQCPPEAGEKSQAFWMIGYLILALFFLIGIVLMVIAVRRTHQWTGAKRIALLLLALIAMLGIWMIGLIIFIRAFIFVC